MLADPKGNIADVVAKRLFNPTLAKELKGSRI